MKKLLLTGGSGFLGQSILPILKNDYSIRTIGINDSDDLKINLSSETPAFEENFELVIHAAGKAHSVPKNEDEALQFFKVNYEGTKNLCKALEKNKPKAFIFISTVAVYGIETGDAIDETYPLNGDSPYAQSKIKAEEYLIDWCKTNDVILGILRPSLIAGKNPPGNLEAMINGIKSGKYFRIGDGAARKSILMAEDIARIIPKLAKVGGVYNVCDDIHPSFGELEGIIAKQLNTQMPKSISYWVAKGVALIGDLLGNKAPINSSKLKKITKSLTFSSEKAKRELNWQPLNVLENFRIR